MKLVGPVRSIVAYSTAAAGLLIGMRLYHAGTTRADLVLKIAGVIVGTIFGYVGYVLKNGRASLAGGRGEREE